MNPNRPNILDINPDHWRAGGRYLPNQDDMASVAFWYQTEPHAAFPALPDRDGTGRNLLFRGAPRGRQQGG